MEPGSEGWSGDEVSMVRAEVCRRVRPTRTKWIGDKTTSIWEFGPSAQKKQQKKKRRKNEKWVRAGSRGGMELDSKFRPKNQQLRKRNREARLC